MASYGDNLTYECLPENDGTLTYNSNGYAAGLLNAARISHPTLSHPTFPSQRPAKYPGWWKPVPTVHFGPQ